MDVDQAFALVDFVAGEYLNFEPFIVLWKHTGFILGRIFSFLLP